MADWTDGAEYAPVERPFGFATPRTAPLAVVEDEPSPAEGKPAVAPAQYQAQPATPLEQLVPAPPSPRDPSVPFDVDGTVAEASWGAVHRSHAWNPRQPFQVDTTTTTVKAGPQLPAPTGPAWAPPTSGPAVPAYGTTEYPQPGYPGAPQHAAPKGPLLSFFTPQAWLTVGLLVLGLLFPTISPYLLIFASLVSSRVLAGQQIIRPAFGASMFALIASWLAEDIFLSDITASTAGQLLCGIMLVVVPASIWWSWRR